MSNVIDEVKSAPDTFTSWDKCMDKAYCKWPAIIGIVVGSLILLSVLFCLVQCICCGVSCAKMLCCCCNGCDCGGKNRRRDRDDRPSHKDNEYHQLHSQNPYSGYQPPSMMAPTYRGVPQTATFEDSKGGDTLPAMPTWDNATTHRVEVQEPPRHRPDDVEMGRLNPGYSKGGYDQVPLSPASPTGAVPGYFPPQQSHPYQSDMGAQRMNHQSTGYGHGFDPAPIPSSPAPTYQTHAPHPSTGDRFMSGAASPPPHHYQSNSPSYAPSSTNYEPSHNDYSSRANTFSPPPAGTMPTGNSYSTYNNSSAFEAQTSPREARPPSLLQVGRKAVPGTRREV
ncbi:uncharacterized protein HMPREF1541_05780 [Cyphellophora europaea CBS 101466]|uniref:Uncharacterized protein n=1 Tax=Cyphellophora europaea (strain CBS 101466) TaxID=1220924 RepID=W2RV25_CYPE1|nr:uncharacterized protein HMPREF1541_05780 [Cyphellophora europaea CBS 101466]ETN39554.1 hypothetical protein HMPREF1541_05780 [Cyphellophora europaea CBS 101466]